MAQAVHAAVQFQSDHPQVIHDWLTASNNLVVVAVPNETEVLVLESLAYTLGLQVSTFREPDLDGQATAVALQPGPLARRLTANLPTALREGRTTPMEVVMT